LTDEELLMALDAELPPESQIRVDVHLARCALCRDRQARLEAVAGRFVDAYQRVNDPSTPGRETRAALASALTRLSGDWERQRPSSFLSEMPSVRRALLSAAGATATALVALGMLSWGLPVWLRTAGVEPGALPVSSLTPGATVTLSLDAICDSAVGDEAVVIPATIRQEVLRAYGMEDVAEEEYELDYLITPRLGGATTARNLWPQRYHARTWNAYIKDQLEDLLPRMVCARQIDLETAQRDIAVDWIAAYKKYFRTRDPLSHLARNELAF
jgi:anti-sigma factor RsiW